MSIKNFLPKINLDAINTSSKYLNSTKNMTITGAKSECNIRLRTFKIEFIKNWNLINHIPTGRPIVYKADAQINIISDEIGLIIDNTNYFKNQFLNGEITVRNNI